MSQAEKDSRKMLMYSFQGGPYTDEQVIHLRDKKKKRLGNSVLNTPTLPYRFLLYSTQASATTYNWFHF